MQSLNARLLHQLLSFNVKINQVVLDAAIQSSGLVLVEPLAVGQIPVYLASDAVESHLDRHIALGLKKAEK